jgi:hypothetical protein
LGGGRFWYERKGKPGKLHGNCVLMDRKRTNGFLVASK